jgi:hypothetical protein
MNSNLNLYKIPILRTNCNSKNLRTGVDSNMKKKDKQNTEKLRNKLKQFQELISILLSMTITILTAVKNIHDMFK